MASSSVCSSSSNHSPSLIPSISFSSLPTKPPPPSVLSLQLPLPSHSPDSISTTAMNAAAQAVGLANAAVQAARNAVSFSSLLTRTSFDEIQSKDGGIIDELSSDSSSQMVVVRSSRSVKTRRKLRKVLKFLEGNDDVKGSRSEFMEKQMWSFSSSSSSSSSSVHLTAREEAEFSFDLKEGARLEAARRRIWEERRRDDQDKDEPTTSEWAEAVGMKRSSLERAVLRTSQSRDRITLSYRGLVVSIATAYQAKGSLTLQDLIQEGSIGLLRGAARFDPQRGYKLSTYVYWWIKQAIIRAIENKSRTIRLSGSMCEMVARIAKAKTTLIRRLGRWPTYDEIGDMIGIDVSIVRLASESSRTPISLDQTPSTVHGCRSMSLQEMISGPKETMPETMVKRQQMKKILHKLLKSRLSEREEFILRLHFGLNGETPRSCDEIGRLLHLSRERVRQIRGLALTKLRHAITHDHINIVDNHQVYTTMIL